MLELSYFGDKIMPSAGWQAGNVQWLTAFGPLKGEARLGRQAVTRREGLVAAAEAGDLAAAFIGLNEIAADLQRVRDRLERAADAAEADNQRLAVSSLSAQQLRAAEVRARLGNVGSYGASRASSGENAQPFVLNIIFSTHTETITATVDHRPTEPTVFDAIEADPTDV